MQSNLFTQDPFDCIGALEVCDNSTLDIDYENAIGSVEEEIDGFCSVSSIPSNFLEFNTIWIKYQSKPDGDFFFTISSSILVHQELNNCMNKRRYY